MGVFQKKGGDVSRREFGMGLIGDVSNFFDPVVAFSNRKERGYE
jgi:hypothetical protein